MNYKLRNQYSTDPQYALQEILKDRGVQDINAFLNPTPACELNPYDLDNIQKGIELLLHHLEANHKLLFIVDCDTDGYCSASILWLYIKTIYPDAQLDFIVHDHKQHGLSDMIERIENNPVYDLIICCDSASYDIEYHQRLGEIGMDCLCIDHHALMYDNDGNPMINTPPNTVVINNQLSNNYQNKSLCGAGVVYKFCEALDKHLQINLAHSFLDLVALGEIADVMDRTTSETNYLMLEGLKHIKNEGFKTLLQAQAYVLGDRIWNPTPIDIAFYIAPLINAITRLGSIAEKENLFYCFIDPNLPVPSTKRGAAATDTETAAESTARIGKNKKARQDDIRSKALDLIDFKIQKEDLMQNNIIFVELDPEDDIPQEMTGLVAMGVVSKYHKPCMLGRRNSENEIQGSTRSDNNFIGLPSLKQFLEQSGLVEYVAGHANANGFGIYANKIDDLLHYANTHLSAADFANCYLVDYILDGAQDNYELLYALAAHPEYFGNQIDEIKVVIKNISLQHFLIMGTNKNCAKISYKNIDYVIFKNLDFIEQAQQNRMSLLDIYGHVNLNYFNGKTSVQVFIDDYEFQDNNDSKYAF